MGGGYELEVLPRTSVGGGKRWRLGGALGDAPGPYTRAQTAEAYKHGQNFREDLLSRNRCATTIFDKAPAAEAPRRALFGVPLKLQYVGTTAAREVGTTARSGGRMYLENMAAARLNKVSKDSGSPIHWDDLPVALSGTSAEIGTTATEGMAQYVGNKAAARRNKISKDSGSPLKWGQLRPLTAQAAAQTVGGTAYDPGAYKMSLSPRGSFADESRRRRGCRRRG